MFALGFTSRSSIGSFLRDEGGAAIIEASLSSLLLIVMVYGIFEGTSYLRARDRINKVADQMAELLSTTPRWPRGLAQARAEGADMMSVQVTNRDGTVGGLNPIASLLRPGSGAVSSDVPGSDGGVPGVLVNPYGVRIRALFCDGLVNSVASGGGSQLTEYDFSPPDVRNADCSGGVFTAAGSVLNSGITCDSAAISGVNDNAGRMSPLASFRSGGAAGGAQPIRQIQPGQQYVVVYAGCTYRPWLSVFASGGIASRSAANETKASMNQDSKGASGGGGGWAIERVTVIPMRNKMVWNY